MRAIATGASTGTGESACATCMINVLVKASSPIAKAGLESLLRPYSDLRLVEDLSKDAREVESELPADVLLVEADTLSDPAAREALDWAGGGATVVLLIRDPAAESVAEALRAGLKAVLRSDIDGPEIRAAIEAAALGLTVLESASLDLVLRAPCCRTCGQQQDASSRI